MIWLWLYLNLIFSINNPLEIGIVVGQLSCMNVHGQHCRRQSRANVGYSQGPMSSGAGNALRQKQ